MAWSSGREESGGGPECASRMVRVDLVEVYEFVGISG